MHFDLLFLTLLFIQVGVSTGMDWLPEQLVETYEMMSGRDTYRYNCSSKTREEWRVQTGEVSTWLAMYYILSGIFFNVLGWTVLYIFITKIPKQAEFSVFKIMIFIGFIEDTEILGVSIWPGIAMLRGDVYCSQPTITTIVGKVTMVQWLTGTTSVIFLGFHRLSNLTRIGKWLMDENWKIYAWLTSFFIYGLFGSFFFDTVLFNSVWKAPLLNPLIIGGAEDVKYENTLLRIHNTIVTIVLIIIYILLSIIYYSRERQTSSVNLKKFEKSILLQSVAISLTYSFPAISFVVIYIVEPAKWLVFISDLSYQLSGGLPFIIYITLNPNIRNKVGRMVGRRAYSDNRIVPVVPFTISNNTTTIK